MADPMEDDLEAFLAGDEIPAGDEWEVPAGSDDVTLQDLADRILHSIRRARAEIAKAEELYRRRVEPLERWRDDRTAGARSLIERQERALEAVTRRLIAMTPKRKSVALPSGAVKLTAPGQPSLVVDDEPELVKWLEENHPGQVTEEVTVTKKYGKAEVKKLVKPIPMSEEEGAGTDPTKTLSWAHDTASGERVPGIHLETLAEDKFGYTI